MTSCPSCEASCRTDDTLCHACGATIDAAPFETVGELLTAAGSRQNVFESRVFLFLCFLGLSPLLLASLETPRLIIDTLSIWTGLCWGVLLFRLFAPPALGIKLALAVLLGTSFLVMPAFEAFLTLWPKNAESWLESDNLIKRFLNYVLVIGVREELFKGLPVLLALWFAPDLRRPRSGIVLGMMAGVGFAATENVYYVYLTLSEALKQATQTDTTALLVPVYNNLVRTMVGPFAHATFSGLMGSFAATAVSRGAPQVWMAGLALAAGLHGLYDTAVGYSGPVAISILALTLFLTIVAHTGAQVSAAPQSRGDGLFSRTILRPVSGPEPQATRSLAPRNRPQSESRPTARSVEPPERFLLVVVGGDEVAIPALGPIRIGRDSTACEVIVNDPDVSRLHATVSMKGTQPQITRVSRVGLITVNQQDVQNCLLSDGDEVRIGDAVIRVKRVARSG